MKKPFRCKACNKRFNTPEARIQHKADTGHTNNPKSVNEPQFSKEFQDALYFVPDDLPDGAYFAMASEIAGVEYGDWFD